MRTLLAIAVLALLPGLAIGAEVPTKEFSEGASGFVEKQVGAVVHVQDETGRIRVQAWRPNAGKLQLRAEVAAGGGRAPTVTTYPTKLLPMSAVMPSIEGASVPAMARTLTEHAIVTRQTAGLTATFADDTPANRSQIRLSAR